MSKFLIVCGGVMSGCGKGVAAASISLLLKLRGHTVTYIKFDPYLNTNAGIMAPGQHGECFLCDDGSEVDLDGGHLERLAGISMSSKNFATAGTLYKELIQEQEQGKFLGSTVQVVPHLTSKIHHRLLELGKEADVVVVEIGGTVGDIESAAFFEAVRQFRLKRGVDLSIIMVAPVIAMSISGELKTKPLQNSVKELQRHGLQPDMLLCRSARPLPLKLLDKVADLTNVTREAIFEAPDVDTVYRVPIEFYDRHVDDLCVDTLHMKRSSCRIHKHRDLLLRQSSGKVRVGVFGKYANSDEAYLSIKEALFHAGMVCSQAVDIQWFNAELAEQDWVGEQGRVETLDAIIVPGGFDKRGVEGKIKAIQYARENKVPFLGICLGLQCAVIEYCRNVANIPTANSQEFDRDTAEPVVWYLKGQEQAAKSGTMRLGAYDCELVKGSLTMELYGKLMISERHRHRLEVNPKYANLGLRVTGTNPQSGLIEIMELDRSKHPFFIGTQAHPEFKSKLSDPAPLFKGLVDAAAKRKGLVRQGEQLLA